MEKRQGDRRSLQDEDVAIAYMDGVDWQHHTLSDAQGTKVFGSERALRQAYPCVKECGIVEVEIRVRRWTQPQTSP